jgi:hypothetical protein
LISSTKSRTARAICAALLPLIGGCAARLELPTTVAALELDDVPFFAQTEFQCGPAALATLLAAAGATVTPEALVDAVYIEGLRGSLQPELLGATRRQGFIPYVLEPQPAALFAELAAGRPVLVMQNLGFDRAPVWHYAVVVGVDPAADRVILRSGTERRLVTGTRRFLRSWQRGENWAFVALAPGALPATASAARYVRAVAGADSLLAPEAANAAYRTALDQWPQDELVLFAAATRKHDEHDLAGATELYRELLAFAPKHAAARNNLANVLAERGCFDQALAEARTAFGFVSTGDALYAAISDTVAEIEQAAVAAGPAQCR